MTFLSRTTPNISKVLQETENIIANQLILNLVKDPTYGPDYRKSFKKGNMAVWTCYPQKSASFFHGDISTIKIDQQLVINNVEKDEVYSSRINRISEMARPKSNCALLNWYIWTERVSSTGWMHYLWQIHCQPNEVRGGIAFRCGWEPTSLPS